VANLWFTFTHRVSVAPGLTVVLADRWMSRTGFPSTAQLLKRWAKLANSTSARPRNP
jgi:hypothetical protein